MPDTACSQAGAAYIRNEYEYIIHPENSVMKKSNLVLCFIATLLLQGMPFLFGQDPLHTEIYRLENGLTVYLNEDHSLPNVFGAVAVRAGSKNDPADATGIAHYFEHIMFKGTDRIGTLDYDTERHYLDSITLLYDWLSKEKDPRRQEDIQKNINRLSIKAAEYAIPNELGKILDEMGSTMVNAGTGNEEIVYYNIFPSNQINKWLEVYSHRFIKPVYRLFQSELETVYEEYNMYKDNRFAAAFEAFNRAFYPDHPYGVPIIGYPEHLKTPSLRKMNEFFETWYVANNMALILSGNFRSDEVKPQIERLFGAWRTGQLPPDSDRPKIAPFKGRTLVQQRLTPIRFGLLGYRLPSITHPDRPALDVLNKMLTNGSQTGALDELSVNNQLLGAYAIANMQVDAGAQIIFFIPKIVGQSLPAAEKLVKEKISDLREGRFDEALLEAVKTQIRVEQEQNSEDQYKRGYMMLMAFVKHMDWKLVQDYPDRVSHITREEVVRVARQYLGDDHLVFYSKTGFPAKPGPLKPPFEPIPSRNTDRQSEYAMSLQDIEVPVQAPAFVKFGTPGEPDLDVNILSIGDKIDMYWVENPINTLFELQLVFGTGTHEHPILDQVAAYYGLCGSETMPFKDFSRKMQALGASYSASASEGAFTVSCTGPEEHLEQVMDYLASWLYNPELDPSRMKVLYQMEQANRKVEAKDPETVGRALYSYAMMGEKSPFLTRLSLKEVGALSPEILKEAMQPVLETALTIHYSGRRPLNEVQDVVTTRLDLGRISRQSLSPVRREYIDYAKATVFFLPDKKAIQSKNYFYVAGQNADLMERANLNAYKEYLDGGMHSVLFQEVRELRSLAYAVGAQLYAPYYDGERVGLTAFVGTQADKTREAVEVIHGILGDVPGKHDRMEMVRSSLIQSINSNKPTFRRVSTQVAEWIDRGYSQDPRSQWINHYQQMHFTDIMDCYVRQFSTKPVVTTIVGNEKRIGSDWMTKYGEVRRVKVKEIFN